MAGDWIKVEKVTARKPEVLRIADILGIHPDHAFGLCVRFWFWCDDQLVDGHAPSVTNLTLNSIVGHSGFAEALQEVGWLSSKSKSLVVPKFDRHLSENSKKRALSLERKRKERADDGTVLSRNERDISVTRARGEQEGEQEVDNLLMSNREAISNSAREAADCDQLPSRLPIKKSSGEDFKPDLSEVDWDRAVSMAVTVARKIPPRSPEDRRNWIRFGVLAQITFSENWLMDSVEAVVRAKETRRTKQAHLYGVLKAKSGEMFGDEGETFVGIVKRIKVPDDVWKSGVLSIQQ